ncbi:MAG: hypothetical protein M3273_07080, partial [Actinomycetota bacterium]|nr:hypothetical protein [Actinomycetota bacterium]
MRWWKMDGVGNTRSRATARSAVALLMAVSLLPLGEAALGGSGRRGCLSRTATIVGTSGDDVIRGTPRSDVIVTGDGDDTVTAGRGYDVVCTGEGDDVAYLGPSHDVIQVGPGADRA